MPHPASHRAEVWIAAPGRRPSAATLDRGLASLGLADPRPVLILVGGAAHLPEAIAPTLLGLFECLAPVLDAGGAAVIDGGTAFGVMALMGEARRRSHARFPLLGIAPRDLVAPDPGGCSEDPAGRARLDPGHSHFMLVPGARWGDETPWINAAAEHLACGRGTLMLVAAGGAVTELDVRHRLRAGGRVLVLAGSGGTADRIAAWRRGGSAAHTDPPATDREPGARTLIEVLDLEQAESRLPAFLTRAFGTG